MCTMLRKSVLFIAQRHALIESAKERSGGAPFCCSRSFLNLEGLDEDEAEELSERGNKAN